MQRLSLSVLISIAAALWLLLDTASGQLLHPRDLFEMSSNLYFQRSFRDIKEDFADDYDFIIVGSGSSGSVLANRLSEDYKVLLLEAGKYETILTDIPLTAVVNQITDSNWGYRADANESSCQAYMQQKCNWPKGRVVGGTSVLNFMVFNRGHRRDFDGWAAAGNTGWSYDEVLKYFMKLENVRVPELREMPYRGKSGPMSIEHSKYQTKLLDAFLEAGQSLGYDVNDPNGPDMLGFSKIQGTIRNGRRCSTAKAYLRPIVNRKNLNLSVKSWATKIIIDEATRTAVGVEFVKNRKTYRVMAKKEVILSAGPIGSPQLLMLSGIGPKEHLDEFSIKTLSNLRVGFNLQDHATLPSLVFTIDKPYSIREADLQVNPKAFFDYWINHSGPLTLPGGSEGISFVKVPNSTLPADYPDVEIVLGPGGMHAMRPEQLEYVWGINQNYLKKTFGAIAHKHGFTLVPILMKPKSRGRISLRSTNPFSWPKLDSGLFTHPDDIKVLTEGIRLSMQIAEHPHFKAMGAKINPTPFYGCRHHSSLNSDIYWECVLRQLGTTLQHQSGTCRMGPHWDENAVVNPDLQVYGINNLRIVDTSIMPEIIAGHPNSVAMMIAEKATDMIKGYWKNHIRR